MDECCYSIGVVSGHQVVSSPASLLNWTIFSPNKVVSPTAETSEKQCYQGRQPGTLNVINLLDVRPNSVHKFPAIVLGVCFNKVVYSLRLETLPSQHSCPLSFGSPSLPSNMAKST